MAVTGTGDAQSSQADDAPSVQAEPDDATTRSATPRASAPAPGPATHPSFTHQRDRHGLIGPFGGAQIIVGALVVVAVAVALVVLTTPLGSVGSSGPRDPRPTPYLIGQPTEGLRIGDMAPELAVTRADGSTEQLDDLSGNPVSLAALRGRGVWVNFWATWCPPCQAETPVLRDTYAQYHDRGLALVSISVQESSPADVAAYAQRYGLGYTIGFDGTGDIFRKFRIYALPTQLFIDPRGVIRAIVQGPLDPTTAAFYVEQILPAAAGSAPAQSAPPGFGSPAASGDGSSVP